MLSQYIIKDEVKGTDNVNYVVFQGVVVGGISVEARSIPSGKVVLAPTLTVRDSVGSVKTLPVSTVSRSSNSVSYLSAFFVFICIITHYMHYLTLMAVFMVTK